MGSERPTEKLVLVVSKYAPPLLLVVVNGLRYRKTLVKIVAAPPYGRAARRTGPLVE
jgi:hypothetical protein